MAIQRFPDVVDEMYRQDKKWGVQDHSDEVWLAILTEEVGEAATGILHARFGGMDSNTRDEVVQVAAVAIQWLDCMDRRKEP